MELNTQIFVWWSFRLKWADPELLQEALRKVLGQLPVFCGTLQGQTVMLNNRGVPFTTTRSSHPTAPGWQHKHGNPYQKSQVLVNHVSPMAVELTCYQDGSAVLALGFSHKVADGMTAWSFMIAWSEATCSQDVSSSQFVEVNTDEYMGKGAFDQVEISKRNKFGIDWAQEISRLTFPDLRTTVAFSHEELTHLKAAAVHKMDKRWVTTQEALTAHLLLVLSRVLYAGPCHAAVYFVLDVRRYLGLPANYRCGAGIIGFPVVVPGDMQTLKLADVAKILHESLQGLTPEKARVLWALRESAAKEKKSSQYLCHMASHFDDCNLVIVMNNQSKMSLPDFGCAGGPTEMLWSSSGGPGQTVVLPTTNGMLMHLGLLPNVLARAHPNRLKEVTRQLYKIPEIPEFQV